METYRANIKETYSNKNSGFIPVSNLRKNIENSLIGITIASVLSTSLYYILKKKN